MFASLSYCGKAIRKVYPACLLTESDFDAMEHMVSSLRPFVELSEEQGGDAYPTLMHQILAVNSLVGECVRPLPEFAPEVAVRFHMALSTGVLERLDTVPAYALAASMLDPRQRGALFNDESKLRALNLVTHELESMKDKKEEREAARIRAAAEAERKRAAGAPIAVVVPPPGPAKKGGCPSLPLLLGCIVSLCVVV